MNPLVALSIIFFGLVILGAYQMQKAKVCPKCRQGRMKLGTHHSDYNAFYVWRCDKCGHTERIT